MKPFFLYGTLVPYEILQEDPPISQIRVTDEGVVQGTERQLPGSGKGFILPLRAPTRERPGQGYLVTFHYNENFVKRNLLRKLIYKGITSLEWMILYRFLEKEFTKEHSSRVLAEFGLLTLSASTRMGLTEWYHQTKPLKQMKKMSQAIRFQQKDYESLLSWFEITLDLPSRFQEVYSFKEVTIPFKEPVPPLVIGVGYKDHGSLKPDHKWLPSPRTYNPPPPSYFENLVSSWKKFYGNMETKEEDFN